MPGDKTTDNRKKNRLQKNKSLLVGPLADAATLGTQMAIAPLLGLACGYSLDKWLGTAPSLLLVFLFIGIAAGFKNLFAEIKRLQAQEDKTPWKTGDTNKKG